MGLPGSGKSTSIRRRFLAEGTQDSDEHLVWIDSDEFKKQHHAYSDADPGALHQWSVQQSLDAFWTAIKLHGNVAVVVDGTGASPEFTDRIREAKAAGFTIELFVVNATVAACLARLQARVRKVPACLLLEKLRGIERNYAAAVELADHLTVVDGETGLLTASSRAA